MRRAPNWPLRWNKPGWKTISNVCKLTPEFVLADPPRAGLGKDVVGHLQRLAPPRMTIVSCDPATLARDLAGLSSYQIESLTMVDLFPQTYHLETIARLRRR